MDELVFRQYLQKRGFSDEVISQHLQAVSEFDEYLQARMPPIELDEVTSAATQLYINHLITVGRINFDTIVALARYGYAIQNYDLFVSTLDLVDGAEVYDNLLQRVGDVMGQETKERIFDGLPVPPLGFSSQEKSHLMRTTMQRLEVFQDQQSYAQLFSSSFRDLPDENYLEDRRKYQELGDIDQFLAYQRERFIEELEGYRDSGRPYFAQPIDQDVIDFVLSDAEMPSGVRQGNILYANKIPYMTKLFLEESDPRLKRYYACHCPWARESILQEEGPVSASFCQCSAGFHKKALEVVFGQPLRAEVLESALQGDLRCRFAIYLPDNLITSTR